MEGWHLKIVQRKRQLLKGEEGSPGGQVWKRILVQDNSRDKDTKTEKRHRTD